MHPDEADRRLRLSLFFEYQDAWFPYKDWPKWVQLTILLKHKKNNDRYRLFLFFTYNGLPPYVALEWITAADLAPSGRLIQGDYDGEAIRHFKQLTRLSEQGILQRQGKNIYNLHTKRVDNKSIRF